MKGGIEQPINHNALDADQGVRSEIR